MAYRDLALSMGMAPPNDQQQVYQAMQQCDSNRDGRVDKMEMFNLFKRMQGVQGGQMMQGGFGQYGGPMQQHGGHHHHHQQQGGW